MIYKDIKKLATYAINHGLIPEEEYVYSINKICDLIGVIDFVDVPVKDVRDKEPSLLLAPLLDYAFHNGKFEHDTVMNRDIFEAKIMDQLIQRPSIITTQFNKLYNESPAKATSYFYDLSQKSNYIKTSRTSKNIIWKSKTPYGIFDMTINLSKPEKDPRDIMAAGNKSDNAYPKCLLCKEHVGFAGAPGRTSHRIIPLSLNKEPFYLQYSPYVYYNEHSIVLMKDHVPMNVTVNTFKRLFDFVDMFPHYFLGSNAGLPIVGGSILAHEHYQGGAHHFGIEDASVLLTRKVGSVTIKKLQWPLSVVRLESTIKEDVIDAASKLYNYWETYTDEAVGIYANTYAPHNAITPIARKKNDVYILDMTLRNNRTSDEFPLGIFHPHPENHHIKKENIGLIEVMGLAVLPARLKDEIPLIKESICSSKDIPPSIEAHAKWISYLKEKYNNQNIDRFIEDEIALKFTKCLENAGVYKQSEIDQKHFDQLIEGYINVFN